KEQLVSAVATVQPTEMLTSSLADGFADVRSAIAERADVEVLVAGGDGRAPAPSLVLTNAEAFLASPETFQTEMFGPASLVITYQSAEQMARLAQSLEGQLTATVQAESDDDITQLLTQLEGKAGRVIWNAWPTGVT